MRDSLTSLVGKEIKEITGIQDPREIQEYQGSMEKQDSQEHPGQGGDEEREVSKEIQVRKEK